MKSKEKECKYKTAYLEKKAKEFNLTIRETVNKLARDYYKKNREELKAIKENKPKVYKYLLDNAWNELLKKYLPEDDNK